jgi:transposase
MGLTLNMSFPIVFMMRKIFLMVIAQQKAEAVIPPRRNRKESGEYGKHLYKERHLVECFIEQDQALKRCLFSL